MMTMMMTDTTAGLIEMADELLSATAS